MKLTTCFHLVPRMHGARRHIYLILLCCLLMNYTVLVAFFCNLHWWNNYFIGKMINHVDLYLMNFTDPFWTGMRTMITGKSERLWFLSIIAGPFFRVCWGPKNMETEVVQPHIFRTCIREEDVSFVCLHECLLIHFSPFLQWSDHITFHSVLWTWHITLIDVWVKWYYSHLIDLTTTGIQLPYNSLYLI